MSDIRQCPAGHLSLDAANWECPWCEVERLREAIRKALDTRPRNDFSPECEYERRAALRGGGE